MHNKKAFLSKVLYSEYVSGFAFNFFNCLLLSFLSGIFWFSLCLQA